MSCLIAYLTKSSAVAEMGDRLETIDMGRKVGELLCPFSLGSWELCNTMWPGPRPTSVPSSILIHLTVGHNTLTFQTDRQTDNGSIAWANRSPRNHMFKCQEIPCTCYLWPVTQSSDDSAMCYILPVLWMTSCFHIIRYVWCTAMLTAEGCRSICAVTCVYVVSNSLKTRQS